MADDLERYIAEQTARNPEFPQLLAKAREAARRPSMAVPAGEWEACLGTVIDALVRLRRTAERFPGRDLQLAITKQEDVVDRFQRVPRDDSA